MSALKHPSNSRNDLRQKIKIMCADTSKTTSSKKTLCMVRFLTRLPKFAKTSMKAPIHNIRPAPFHNSTLWSPQSLKPWTRALKWKRSFLNTRPNPCHSLNRDSNITTEVGQENKVSKKKIFTSARITSSQWCRKAWIKIAGCTASKWIARNLKKLKPRRHLHCDILVSRDSSVTKAQKIAIQVPSKTRLCLKKTEIATARLTILPVSSAWSKNI